MTNGDSKIHAVAGWNKKFSGEKQAEDPRAWNLGNSSIKGSVLRRKTVFMVLLQLFQRKGIIEYEEEGGRGSGREQGRI